MRKPQKKKKLHLGEFEEIVLMAIRRLGADAYGVPIRRLIEAETNRSVSFGALYTTFDRLEAKGYISSWQGGATSERGGRAKRYLRVEPAGLEALHFAEQDRIKLSGKLQSQPILT